MKNIKIGIDLDGVIVNKPFFVPKKLIEWLFRAHSNHDKKYRIPTSKIEIAIRKISHHWLIRPPINKNIKIIKKLAKAKNIDAYLVSGRYNFLQEKTNKWLKINGLAKLFPTPFINLKNQQPHLFKEAAANKLELDYFFDDDPIIIDYFGNVNPKLKACLTSNKNNTELEKLLEKTNFS